MSIPADRMVFLGEVAKWLESAPRMEGQADAFYVRDVVIGYSFAKREPYTDDDSAGGFRYTVEGGGGYEYSEDIIG